MNRELKAIKIHNEDGLDAAASLMQDYVDQARQIDTQLCPHDFAEAYYRNITAWADEGEAIRAHPHIQNSDEAFVNGFFRGLQGDMSGGAEEIKSEISERQKNLTPRQSEVEITWKKVQALVVRYGV